MGFGWVMVFEIANLGENGLNNLIKHYILGLGHIKYSRMLILRNSLSNRGLPNKVSWGMTYIIFLALINFLFNILNPRNIVKKNKIMANTIAITLINYYFTGK